MELDPTKLRELAVGLQTAKAAKTAAAASQKDAAAKVTAANKCHSADLVKLKTEAAKVFAKVNADHEKAVADVDAADALVQKAETALQNYICPPPPAA